MSTNETAQKRIDELEKQVGNLQGLLIRLYERRSQKPVNAVNAGQMAIQKLEADYPVELQGAR